MSVPWRAYNLGPRAVCLAGSRHESLVPFGATTLAGGGGLPRVAAEISRHRASGCAAIAHAQRRLHGFGGMFCLWRGLSVRGLARPKVRRATWVGAGIGHGCVLYCVGPRPLSQNHRTVRSFLVTRTMSARVPAAPDPTLAAFDDAPAENPSDQREYIACYLCGGAMSSATEPVTCWMWAAVPEHFSP